MVYARRSSRVVGVVALAILVGCGPGVLPDPSFGSGGDEYGEPSTLGPEGADGPEGVDGPDSSASSLGEEASSSSADTNTNDEASNSSSNGEASTTTDAETSASTSSSDDASTSADTSASESSTETSASSDEGNWGIPPDVTNEPCNPLAQDCFPTHKCVPYSTVPGSPFLDADKCMPILGDKGWGEPCTLSNFNEAQDDCDGEGFCWNLEWVEGELQGTCVPFCTGSPQNLMCPSGWGCLFSGAVALCSKQCNPLLQDCPDQYACFWILDAFQCSLTGSLGQDADPCDQANDCVPGLGCVAQADVPGCPGNANTCCTPFCDLDTPNCPGGRECVAFFGLGDAPPGFEDVGICLKP